MSDLLTQAAAALYGRFLPAQEVIFVSTKQFTNRKWGTSNPVIVRDPTLGPVRLRAFGTYALRVQDRVIRLEERLRLLSVLPEPLRSRVGELSGSQLIALRFAPDAELAGLVDQILQKKLERNEIKKAVVSWRADYSRI